MKNLYWLLLVMAVAACQTNGMRRNTISNGDWVSVQDSLSVIRIQNETAYGIYASRPVDTLKFEISGKSCDDKWKSNTAKPLFIKWEDGICHEIVTLNDTALELIYTGNGRTQAYRKLKK